MAKKKTERRPRRMWTKKELDFIKKNAQTMTNKELAEKLDRNIGSISIKVIELGVRDRHKKEWTDEEMNFIKENASKMTNQEIADALGINIGYIAKLIPELGLERKRPRKTWTVKEIEFLQENTIKMTNQQLADALGRNISSVATKIVELDLSKTVVRESGGRRRWADEEVEFMKENADKLTNKQIAEKLGRSIGSVALKTCDLGLKRRNKRKNWTDEEVEFMKENIDKLTYVQMGYKLDRTAECVRAKAKALGISNLHNIDNLDRFKSWTKDEEQYILNHLDSSNYELARALGRGVASIRGKKHHMGLSTPASKRQVTKNKDKKWEKDTLYFLVSSYPTFDFDFISMFTGIDEEECKRKFKSLTEDEKKEILNNFKK